MTLKSSTLLVVGMVSLAFVWTGIGEDLTWVGDGINNPWDIGSSLMWTNASGTVLAFGDADNVTFDDTGSASPDITLTTSVQPGSVTVNNSTANAYTFSGVGSLSGAMTLTKAGTGTLTLNTTNSYSGNTVIDGGILALSGGNDRLPTATPLIFTAAASLDLGSNSQTLGALSMTTKLSETCTSVNGSLTVNGGITVGATVTQKDNILDLRGMSGLTVNTVTSRLDVSGMDTSNTGNSRGQLYLPANADITVPEVWVGMHPSGSGAANRNLGYLYLGQSTAIKTDCIYLGRHRGHGYAEFATGLTAPTVSLRNTNGPSSRVRLIRVGSNTGTSGTTVIGQMKLSAGNVDILVNDLVVGSGESANTSTYYLGVFGYFMMGGGTLDATNLCICLNTNGGYNDNTSSFTQSSGTVKAQTLTMGRSTASTVKSGHPVLKATYSMGTDAVLYAQTIACGIGAFGPSSLRTLNLSNSTLRNYDATTNLLISGVEGTGGTLSIVLASATTNTFYADTDQTITVEPTAVISGSGAVAKDGPGTLLLNAVNTFTGATTVKNGTLGGVGTIPGSVEIATGARLEPGTNGVTGILTCGSLTLAADVTNAFDCSAATNDSIVVTGDLTLQGANAVALSYGNDPVPLQVPIFAFGTLVGEENLASWTVSGAGDKYTSHVRRLGNQLVVINTRKGLIISVL